MQNAPKVTVVIPSLDRSRSRYLEALMRDLEGQTLQDFEVRVVEGDRRQGRAINRGVCEARGDIIVILDDDTRLASDSVLERLVECLDHDPSIGMVGASTLVPDWANRLQKRAMRELPRRVFPLVSEVTQSDMVQHPCCALRREVFREAGGEREDIVRGLDPYLRQRIRDCGYRVVVAPNCGVYHLLPARFSDLMRMAFRNGAGSAFAQRTHPELVMETGDGFDESFSRRVPFRSRIVRYPFRILDALCHGRPILFCWLLAYALGHACGYLWLWRGMKERERVESPSGNQ